jgi:hypothetical protein
VIQSVTGELVRAEAKLRLVNGIVFLVYIYMCIRVVLSLQSGGNFGGVVLILCLLSLAVGHLWLAEWALKTSAAISMVASLLMMPYLLGAFESELLPSGLERLLNFVGALLIAGCMVANYLILIKLRGGRAS